MTCEEMKTLWGDYLLGALPPKQQEMVETHLKSCKACQAELQEFRKTLALMQGWPDVEPAQRLIFVPATGATEPVLRRKWQQFWQNWRQAVRWAVAFGVVALLILGVSRTQFSYKDGDLEVAFGRPLFEKNSGELPLPSLVEHYQTETVAAVAQLIQASEERQQQNLLLAIDHLNQQWYQQRQSDFKLIATGFQALKAESENRALQTNQLVQWLIQQQGSANPVHLQKIGRRKK